MRPPLHSRWNEKPEYKLVFGLLAHSLVARTYAFP